MRSSDIRSWLTSTAITRVVVALLTVMCSLGVAAVLPDAAWAPAPDGSRERLNALVGPGCDKVPAARSRIASAALVTDEILLELLDRHRWSAVSYVVDWPSATPVSARFDPSIPRTWGTAEHLLRLAADRVFVSEYTSSAATAQLASAGRCVIEVRAPRTLDELLGVIALVGEATGTGARAARLIAELRERLAQLPKPRLGRGADTSSRRARPRALVLQGLRAFGYDTVQGDCLRRAGLDNAAVLLGLRGTPLLPSEALSTLELDFLFLTAPVAELAPAKPEHLPGGVAWPTAPIIRRGRVFAVPESWVASLSHHALLACEAYARAAWGDSWRP